MFCAQREVGLPDEPAELDRMRLSLVLAELQSEQFSVRVEALKELERILQSSDAALGARQQQHVGSSSSFGFGWMSSGSGSGGGGGGGGTAPGAASPLRALLTSVRLAGDLHSLEARLLLETGELDRWLADNEVLALSLQGNLDQSYYLERVKPLVDFLAPRLLPEQIKQIWDLQVRLALSPSLLLLCALIIIIIITIPFTAYTKLYS